MMADKEEIIESGVLPIYTIIHTAVDVDRGQFPGPANFGSFLSHDAAKAVMASLVKKEKESLSPRYDKIDEDEDGWEAYEDGYAAGRFSRFEILSSALHCDEGCLVTERCPHCETEITMLWSTEKNGYRAFCPVCGEPLMLCDECRHTRGNTCNYSAATRSCMLGDATRYPELAEYEDHHQYLPKEESGDGEKWYGCYEIIFDVEGERFYCFVYAKNLAEALGRFFMSHPHITYDKVAEHIEAGTGCDRPKSRRT